MNNSYVKAAVLAAATICSSSILHAAPITYNFSATGFFAMNGGPVPVDSVSGSFTMDGTVLTQWDLTLGSRTYSVADVAFYGEYSLVGSKLNGAGVTVGTDDFWLEWLKGGEPTNFYSFFYTMAGAPDGYASSNGTISAVPVPGAAWLLGSGLMGLAGLARRRQAAA